MVFDVGLLEPEKHIKGWGYELWYVNEPYCMKLLVVDGERECSVHAHKEKDETFRMLSGGLYLDLYPKSVVDWTEVSSDVLNASVEERTRLLGPVSRLVFHPGDTIRIHPGLPHRFRGIHSENSMLELSTIHYEEDSIRILDGDSQRG